MWWKLRNLFAVLLLVLSTAAMPLLASAQDAQTDDDDGNYTVLNGVIEAVGEGFIVIAGLTIDISGLALDDDDDDADDDDAFVLEVGVRVEVIFEMVDGAFVAIALEDVGAHDDDEEDGGGEEEDEDGDDDGGEEEDDEEADDEDDEDEYEVEENYLIGTLEVLEQDFVVVSGVTFDTTEAEVRDDVAVDATVVVEYVAPEGDDDDAGDDEATVLVALYVGVYSDEDDDDDEAEEEEDNDDSGDDDDDAGDDDGDDEVCVIEQPDGWVSYIVREGDTLSAIAVASDTDLDDLLEVNCIEDAALIVVGTTLFVENEPDFTIIEDDDDGGDDNDDGGDDDGGDDDNDDSGDDDGGDDDNDDSGDDDDEDDDDGDDDDGGDDDGDDDNEDEDDDDGDDE